MRKSPARRPRNGIKGDPPQDEAQQKAGSPRAKQKRNARKNDPEALALSKADILEFCDRVLKKWQHDQASNARNIPAMIAVRTSVFFSDEASLKAIWAEIISWVYQLLYENAQAHARSQGESWAEVFAKIKRPE